MGKGDPPLCVDAGRPHNVALPGELSMTNPWACAGGDAGIDGGKSFADCGPVKTGLAPPSLLGSSIWSSGRSAGQGLGPDVSLGGISAEIAVAGLPAIPVSRLPHNGAQSGAPQPPLPPQDTPVPPRAPGLSPSASAGPGTRSAGPAAAMGPLCAPAFLHAVPVLVTAVVTPATTTAATASIPSTAAAAAAAV